MHKFAPVLKNESVVLGSSWSHGQVLAAWLVAEKGFSNRAAISTVKTTGRNPYEAVITALLLGRNPWKVAADLHAIRRL